MKNLFNKGILTGILGILFIGSLIFAYNQSKQKNETVIKNEEYQVIIKSNNILIDTLKKQVFVLNKDITRLLKVRSTGKEIDKKITSKYKKVYEKIDNSDDTLQLSILHSLLAKHRGLSVERD